MKGVGTLLEALHGGAGGWAWRLAAACFDPSWRLFETMAGSPFALWWLPEARGWAVLPALQAIVVPEAYRGPFAVYAALLIPGLFCLSMMFFALNPIFQIRRRTLPVIAAAGVGLAVDVLGLLVLPGLFGTAGIALAQSFGLTAAFLWLAARALTGRDRLHLPWREIGTAAAACLAMGLALAPFRHLEPRLALATCLPLGIGLYGALVWIFDIAGLRGHVLARFGHALSDRTRARVLLALRESPAFPADLADVLDVSRQVVSNHLACLRGCGLVVAVPQGRRVRYELADPRLAHALGDLLGVVLAVDPCSCGGGHADGCCP